MFEYFFKKKCFCVCWKNFLIRHPLEAGATNCELQVISKFFIS